MRILLITVLSLFMLSTYPNSAQAQFKKLKDKMKKVGKKVIGGDDEKDKSNPNSQSGSNQNGKMQGKKLTPPDVNENLDNANAAYSNKRYSDLRFAIKEAMRGIELEIGEKILGFLPTEVAGAKYIEAEDQIISTGIGFAGLVIGRQYEGNKKNIQAQIANNSLLLANYNTILTSGSYATNDGEYKTIMVQGFRSALRFDGDNKYSLGVPIGQSTIFVLDLTNVADENEVKSIANNFDLQKIKETLGEQ